MHIRSVFKHPPKKITRHRSHNDCPYTVIFRLENYGLTFNWFRVIEAEHNNKQNFSDLFLINLKITGLPGYWFQERQRKKRNPHHFSEKMHRFALTRVTGSLDRHEKRKMLDCCFLKVVLLKKHLQEKKRTRPAFSSSSLSPQWCPRNSSNQLVD